MQRPPFKEPQTVGTLSTSDGGRQKGSSEKPVLCPGALKAQVLSKPAHHATSKGP